MVVELVGAFHFRDLEAACLWAGSLEALRILGFAALVGKVLGGGRTVHGRLGLLGVLWEWLFGSPCWIPSGMDPCCRWVLGTKSQLQQGCPV